MGRHHFHVIELVAVAAMPVSLTEGAAMCSAYRCHSTLLPRIDAASIPGSSDAECCVSKSPCARPDLLQGKSFKIDSGPYLYRVVLGEGVYQTVQTPGYGWFDCGKWQPENGDAVEQTYRSKDRTCGGNFRNSSVSLYCAGQLAAVVDEFPACNYHVQIADPGCCAPLVSTTTSTNAPMTSTATTITTTSTTSSTSAPIAPFSMITTLTTTIAVVALLVTAAGILCCHFRGRKSKHSGSVGDSSTNSGAGDLEDGLAVGPVDHSDDPAWAAISLEQLNALRDRAREELGSRFHSATMYDINEHILMPLCALHGKSYARIVNSSALLRVHIFVSHAWAENFDEFVNSVNAAFAHWTKKPTLWICSLALIQSRDPAVIASQVGTGDDPFSAPFSKALAEADKILIVRNSTVNLYDRIWCCWELYIAHRLQLTDKPGGVIVTGPRSSDSAIKIDIASARSFSMEDKRMILQHVLRSAESYEAINSLLTEVWMHGFFSQS